MSHIHVGSNMPGYLPEGDIYCTDTIDDALGALRFDLQDAADHYFELCEAENESQWLKGSDCCDWCDVGYNVAAAINRISNGDAAYSMENGGDVLFNFSPPEGPDLSYWAVLTSGEHDGCELAEGEF